MSVTDEQTTDLSDKSRTRQTTVRELPASIELASVNMRLDHGGMLFLVFFLVFETFRIQSLLTMYYSLP